MKNRYYCKWSVSLSIVVIIFCASFFPVYGVSSCRINWNAEEQVIDGFGGSGAFHQAENLRKYPEADRNRILDLLFSREKGIGLSIVRNIVGDGGDWGREIDGPTPSIEPTEGVWNWTGDEGQIWLMNEAKKRGCTRFVSTVWSPPAWMKTNNKVIDGGELRPDKYQAFADYLSHYVRGYKDHHHIEIYGISPANEPDLTTAYSSCRWTGLQFRDFIKNYLQPTFKRDGVTAKLIMPEAMNFNEDFAIDTLSDPVAEKAVSIVASHAYDYVVKPFPVAKRLKKAIWQTEVSNIGFNDGSMDDGLKYAKLLHDHMTVSGVNSWSYWWLMTYKENEGGSLVSLDLTNQTYYTFKRLYTLGNYTRFVRPGYVRIGADPNPLPDVYVTAYKEKSTGKFAIVAINKGTGERAVNLNLNGFPAVKTLIPYRTSGTEDLAKLARIPVAGKSCSVTLKPKSVTTFVGITSEMPALLSFREVLSPLDAVTYDDQSGVVVEPTANGGKAVVLTKKGAFTAYRNINFGNGTAVCDVQIAEASGSGKLELLADSSMGTVIGRYNIPATQLRMPSWKNTVWKTITIPTEKIRGVHDLYLVYTSWDAGSVCKVKEIQFKGLVVPPPGQFKVQMANETVAPETDKIALHYKIVNNGKVPVKLEEVKLRYYYTLDIDSPQQFENVGGTVPNTAVNGTFIKMNALAPKANYYLEIGFTAAAGSLEPGKDAEIRVAISAKGSAYHQENDFSFNPKQDGLADWEASPGYLKGKLCWGSEPSLLINPGFEDGTVNGWFNFGPCKITVTKDASQTGTHSVLISNRTEAWQGVSQDLMAIMKPGLKYEVSGWIKLKNKAHDAGRICIKRTDGRGDNYSWVDAKTVNDEEWTFISGVYELKVEGTLKTLQLYTEGPEPGVDYYVDNLVVREVFQ